jgi:signal transduction histidine kinase
VCAALAVNMNRSIRSHDRVVEELRDASSKLESANKELIQTRDRLEKLDAVKTDFITIASHELRTPLTQVRGYIDILDAMNESGTMNREQMTKMAGNLRKASDRMERLIGDMLDVSQLDTDAMDLRFGKTSVESMMKVAIEPLIEAVTQRKLSMTSRGLRTLPPVEADMQRMVQAFRNVVGNAVKYTPDGGQINIMGELQKNATTKQDEIKITIEDTGIGIDPRYHELIFEKFFRVGDPSLHSTGSTKFMGAGPGLGLTIARGVIQGHGGTITVYSEREDRQNFPGTTFVITLPLQPPADAKSVAPFERPTIPNLALARPRVSTQ